MSNESPSREERLKLVEIAIQRAMSEPCPYCKDLDISDYKCWQERSQHLIMEADKKQKVDRIFIAPSGNGHNNIHVYYFQAEYPRIRIEFNGFR